MCPLRTGPLHFDYMGAPKNRKDDGSRTISRLSELAESARGELRTRGASAIPSMEALLQAIQLELQNLEYRANFRGLLSLYEDTPIGYLVLDEELTIRRMNRAAVNLVRVPRSARLGRDVSALLEVPKREELAGLLESLEEGEMASRPAEVRLGDGSLRRMQLAMRRMPDGESPEDGTLGPYRLGLVGRNRLESENDNPADVLAWRRGATARVVRRLQERLIRGRAAVSERIHDEIAQYLTLARMKIGEIKSDCDDPRMPERLEEVERLAEESLRAARRIMTELSPSAFDFEDLGSAIESLVRIRRERGAPEINFTKSGKCPKIEPGNGLLLVIAAEELIDNAIRHAGAEHVLIQVRCASDRLRLRVEDDGRGMADSKIDGGLGIDGLRRSADLLEGSLEIEDVPTGGTAIIVSFPND